MMGRYAWTRVRSLAVEIETEALDRDTRTYLNTKFISFTNIINERSEFLWKQES